MKTGKKAGNQGKYVYEQLIAMTFILLVLSLVFNQPLLFLLVGVMAVYAGVGILYEKKMADRLTMVNEELILRMFPGDEERITFSFKNTSRFPLVNGRLSFRIKDIVVSEAVVRSKDRQGYKYELPFSIIKKGITNVTFSFAAKARGTTRIRHISYLFPHVTSFQPIELSFHGLYKTEIIIYPNPIPVLGIEKIFTVAPGTQRAYISPFEEYMEPVGTRGYVNSDSFSSIHWKATARTNTLQTKTYEKRQDFTWMFVVDLAESSPVGNLYFAKDKENIISSVAYLCQVAVDKGYPFQIVINIAKAGNNQFLTLGEGEGRAHLKTALELLARVDPASRLVSLPKLNPYIDKELYKPKTVVLFSSGKKEQGNHSNYWYNKGSVLFQVIVDEQGAVMKKCGGKG
ncbi:DUF58 domain-containing protein [Sediminibacillus massiliensis]|uniref:DUF58 domain-containing protein n=1 Tax=Sediminibacillus massiliensis TaxID=1926277 RepID=UPI00098865B3|nr:DUF58 domain-containing protein [Sediminibacillus massiliensis]